MKNSKQNSPRSKDLRTLKRVVWSYYKKKRRSFPWRVPALKLRKDGSVDPYKILVSEIMLQQTQAGARTIEKYKAFIKRFPTSKVLAEASLSEVYALWQGLGYNRRVKALRDAALLIESELDGVFPSSPEELQKLPGVGPYTASAVYVFAYNKPAVLIETNIRTVFLHHLFRDRGDITDAELLPHITDVVDKKRSREWYSALMDYGAYLKREVGNVSRRSKHYIRQSTFKGSARELRGRILRLLLEAPGQSLVNLSKWLKEPEERVEDQLKALLAEGFLIEKRGSFSLA